MIYKHSINMGLINTLNYISYLNSHIKMIDIIRYFTLYMYSGIDFLNNY